MSNQIRKKWQLEQVDWIVGKEGWIWLEPQNFQSLVLCAEYKERKNKHMQRLMIRLQNDILSLLNAVIF